MKTIILAGGTGQVGQILARELENKYKVIILTRGQARTLSNLEYINWDVTTLGAWAKALDGAEAVINLAGRTVNCRYNPKNRREILESRVHSTRVIGEAIAAAKNPPKVWLQAVSGTIYTHRFDAPNDDVTGQLGGAEAMPDTWRFSVNVAKAWEKTLQAAQTPQTRKVTLRSAMVLSPDQGGVFSVLHNLVKYGLGGTMGDGKQYISWIHDTDFIAAILFLLEQPIEGAVNLCSPNPLPNAEFMRLFRSASGIRFGLPSTNWMLELGAIFLQTETELVLKSRFTYPKRLLEAGFKFKFADWETAAQDLVKRS
jgi:uncharacterized protein